MAEAICVKVLNGVVVLIFPIRIHEVYKKNIKLPQIVTIRQSEREESGGLIPWECCTQPVPGDMTWISPSIRIQKVFVIHRNRDDV